LDSFDKSISTPASERLSTFDWVSEKAAELKAQARTALANRGNRQLAVEGATFAAGLAASAVLHVNLSKSVSVVEGIVAGHTEEATIKTILGQSRTVANDHLVLPETPFKSSRIDAVQPASLPSPREPLFDGGFTLPEGVSFASATKVAPFMFVTRGLPDIADPLVFDQTVAKRLGLTLESADSNSIGIMHPRFRNGAKQLAMRKSPERDLSLYGNEESGIGVLEYERLPSARSYFKYVDAVVQIKSIGATTRVGGGTLISSDGLIATAAHVVPLDSKIIVDTVKGQFEADVVVRRHDGKFDIAAIQLKGVPENIAFTVPTITSAELTKGARVAMVGHPQGLSQRFASLGSYQGPLNIRRNNMHPSFKLDAVMPGSSGGPIFDAEGNLAVIATRINRPANNRSTRLQNRATAKGEYIEDLLKLIELQWHV
jgi:S1-C subfamily serine protease